MLRGVLATYVLLGHARAMLWVGHTAWMAHPHGVLAVPLVYASASLRYGREAVMVFFVLSGFFIHLRWTAGPPGGPSPAFSAPAFYKRRAHRLVAPYALALAVTMVLDALGRLWFPSLYHAATGYAVLDAVFGPTGYSWRSVLPAMVLLPSSLGFDFGSNGPLWSLAYEMIYYAMYPAWLMVRRRSGGGAYVVIPAACLGAGLALPFGFASSVIARYPIWLAGAALAERSASLPRSVGAVLLAAAIVCAGVALHVTSRTLTPLVVAAMIYGVGAVMVFASAPEAWLRSRAGAALVFLGDRSYTIYIVHFPFLALLAAWAIERPGGLPFHGWLAVGGSAAALAFGCACFEASERHFRHGPIGIGEPT
jgi:peptidoglycan/LPS O-acetylase OafA/YrhL